MSYVSKTRIFYVEIWIENKITKKYIITRVRYLLNFQEGKLRSLRITLIGLDLLLWDLFPIPTDPCVVAKLNLKTKL